MTVIIGKIRCYFCGEKGGVMKSVHQHGIYGEIGKRYFYHQECLEMIEVEPEKFAQIMADKAIHINDLVKKNTGRYNKTINQKFKKRVEKLNTSHFERMMPKQL